MQRRAHGIKRLNFLEDRATETEANPSATQAQSTSDATTKSVVDSPPTSTKALAAVISVVGVLAILGIVIWRYKTRRSRSRKPAPSLAGRVTIEKEFHFEKHIDLNNVDIYTEKPQKAVLTPRSFDSEVGWVPQIKTYPPTEVSIPEPTASFKSKSKSHALQLSVKTSSEGSLDVALSPPPSYFIANGGAEQQSPRLIPIPPSPAASTTHPPTPPTPPATRKATSFASRAEQPAMPMPSPRSESFATHDIALPIDPIRNSAASGSDESGSSQRLPRLMTVAASFTPTLDDELAIKLGDTVRMVDEYRDGWCLVQRVGRIDAPKGAVPRFCLQERRGVVPMVPTRKFSNGSLKSQGWR
ncbi:hypothetical protein Hypma_010610 [Hypsizygus marmoreus]|uniref:SH3 domain-containing protein n=1 Tax=Hypsizygus marmoreus TaxID=39966 RepID=A0A369JK03_HYPMA|nr:hypothetical protein Hypma_010610 [Hypsizygus marmoreus]